MTWIKTVPATQVDESDIALRSAYAALAPLYPPEYGQASKLPELAGESIVASHSLIPDALRHAFSTFGALLAGNLPLTRRQHEMIATLVSVQNSCFY
jgi:alkylhydroperoxidase family enzyme